LHYDVTLKRILQDFLAPITKFRNNDLYLHFIKGFLGRLMVLLVRLMVVVILLYLVCDVY